MNTSKGTIKINKSGKLGKLGWITGVLVTLAVGFNSAQSQVVLVQSKPQAARSAGKTKARPKVKMAAKPLKPVAPPVRIEPSRATELPFIPKAMPTIMSFAVTPPSSFKVETAEATAKMTAWPELLGYEFDVIAVNDHGRERERRRERARFYLEGLKGGLNLEMVEVPAGMFLMGSNDAQLAKAETSFSRGSSRENKVEINARLRAEAPQRMVKVTGFFMSKYEVTQAQWRAVAGLPKINMELMSDPSQFKGGNRPVEQISWEEAMEFCERLSRATGRRYRLPTEAEWEYAAREGGKKVLFGNGKNVADPSEINFDASTSYKKSYSIAGEYRKKTIPVGSLRSPNALGLHDMSGNVWEWCSDWKGDYPAGAQTNPTGPTTGSSRVIRGGSWGNDPQYCRVADRSYFAPGDRYNGLGFRLARTF